MREIAEQFHEQFWIVVHHRWLALICWIVICAIGWVIVEHLPNQYQSETKVYLDTQTVLKTLLRGLAIDNQMREQSAEIMQRTLVTRPNLEKVIEGTDLNLGINGPKEMEKIVNELRKNIRITSVSLLRSQTRDQSSNLYLISYTNKDPVLAKNVVDVLLNIFIENILGASRKDTLEAQKFLDEQIKEYEKKQHIAEERLKDFKQKHFGLMPEAGQGYYTRIKSLEATLEGSKLALSEAQKRSAEIKNQIRLFENSASENTSKSMVIIKDPLDIRIESLEASLDELLLQYTDQHPDVISKRRVLEQLREQKKEKERQPLSDKNTSNSNIINSPLYQELKVMLSTSEAEVAALITRVNAYKQRIEKETALLETLPEVEAELSNLNRDYKVNKELYENLVKRRESSKLSSEAEQSGDEIQFKIIEPPRVPLTPVKPNRLLLVTVVMFLGIGGGIGIAWLDEQLRPAFYSRQALVDNIDLPLLGSVSMFWSNAERSRRRIGIAFFGIISIILFISYAGLLIHYGLDFNVEEYSKKIFGDAQ